MPINTIHEIEHEPLRVHADSDTMGRKPYLIDFEAFDGNGSCECPAFWKFYKRLKRGERSDTTELMCKHLKRAHIWNSRRLIGQIQAQRRRSFPNRRVPHYQDDA